MVATEAIDMSEPVDVTIGGLTGKQVDMRLDPGWTETCPGDPPTFDLGDTRRRVILLDTPDHGVTFVNVDSLHSEGHEAFLAEAMPIVESFQFDSQPVGAGCPKPRCGRLTRGSATASSDLTFTPTARGRIERRTQPSPC